jgi:hypothetical protein
MTNNERKEISQYIFANSSSWKYWIPKKLWNQIAELPPTTNDLKEEIIKMRVKNILNGSLGCNSGKYQYSNDGITNFYVEWIPDMEKKETKITPINEKVWKNLNEPNRK